MEFFADDEVVNQLELELASARAAQFGPLQLQRMLCLCWQLRQRDGKRALLLADELEKQVAHEQLPSELLRQYGARIMLVRAEVYGLHGDTAKANSLLEAALRDFTMLDDPLGCADAHWLSAWLAFDQGETEQANLALTSVATLSAGNDQVRSLIAMAQLARYWVQTDLKVACQEWVAYFPDDCSVLPIAAQCWIMSFRGIMAREQSDYVQTVKLLSQVYALALASGQIRLAISSAASIGDAFNQLNDFHTALDWMQRALELARRTGWPAMIGLALKQSAESLRCLQRYDAAHSMLQEALQLMSGVNMGSHYAHALQYLGYVELARQQYHSALANFILLERRALSLKQVNMLAESLRGQAQSFFELGQPEEALQIAQACLLAAPSHVVTQIEVLRVMAAMHARYDLPAPPDLQAASIPLHYLQRALSLAATIENYTIPGDLLESVAQEYAALDDYALAYRYACEASAAREKTHSREAGNRASALQVSYQTESALAEEAHQRELASEAKRAEILQQTSDTLKHLGEIGQEITAHLNKEEVFAALNRHIHHLLAVDIVGVGLMDDDGNGIRSVFSVQGGQILPNKHFSMQRVASPVVRCVLERREITDQVSRIILPTTEALSEEVGNKIIYSRMFAPLCLADKVLGAMTIQAKGENAYDKREKMIFRTLCAYTAIALSNADAHGKLASAHRQLQETQQHMVLQGKMAGLGSLTAGVAHEINNPTNFVHVAAQNQKIDLAEFQEYVYALVEADDAPQVVLGFQERFAKLEASLATMQSGTERIKTIVRDLRAFTRLEEAEKKSVRLSECLLSTLNLVRTSWLEKVEFITEFNDDPLIECWPALLNQVFMNLLVNGCQAIEEKRQTQAQSERGKILLRLFQQEQLLVIMFEDSGVGISQEAQARIMEPFYTTKSVGVGTGLGLSIAFNIVQKHGGTLTFTSLPGEGSCFTIQLPLQIAN